MIVILVLLVLFVVAMLFVPGPPSPSSPTPEPTLVETPTETYIPKPAAPPKEKKQVHFAETRQERIFEKKSRKILRDKVGKT
jgi:hypothetical protein